MRTLIVRLFFSLLILLALLVLYDLARAETDEFLNHRLASGEQIQYIWKDTIDQPWLGKTEVLGCAGSAIRVRNSWLNQTHEFTLYSGDWQNETVQEPRVEWFTTCQVFVKTNITLYGKQVARLLFVPLLPKSDLPWPP